MRDGGVGGALWARCGVCVRGGTRDSAGSRGVVEVVERWLCVNKP